MQKMYVDPTNLYLSNQYLLGIYYVPGLTEVDAGDAVCYKTNQVFALS